MGQLLIRLLLYWCSKSVPENCVKMSTCHFPPNPNPIFSPAHKWQKHNSIELWTGSTTGRKVKSWLSKNIHLRDTDKLNSSCSNTMLSAFGIFTFAPPCGALLTLTRPIGLLSHTSNCGSAIFCATGVWGYAI